MNHSKQSKQREAPVMKHGKFDINPTGRDFFVGDLHGMLTEFYAELAAVDFDFDNDRMFCVGDLIDRGNDSMGCLQLLKEHWFHCVKGNHEDMMLGGLAYHIWMYNGGEWWQELDTTEQDYCEELVRDTLFDKITVETEYGRIGVAHADVFGRWEDANMNTTTFEGVAELLWGRRRIHGNILDKVEGVDAVVVGHTPVKFVTTRGNVVYIDTGAFYDEGFMTVIDAKTVIEFVNGVVG
jgi:serine/threonine protein phosphatase 1